MTAPQAEDVEDHRGGRVPARRDFGPPGLTPKALRGGLAYDGRVDELGREAIEVYGIPDDQ